MNNKSDENKLTTDGDSNDESTKEGDVMSRKIDKSNITGLTTEKKEVLKSLMGSVKSPLDLNKMRDELKYGKD